MSNSWLEGYLLGTYATSASYWLPTGYLVLQILLTAHDSWLVLSLWVTTSIWHFSGSCASVPVRLWVPLGELEPVL